MNLKLPNECFINKNGNVASNIKLSKIKNVAGIMKRRKYIININLIHVFLIVMKNLKSNHKS